MYKEFFAHMRFTELPLFALLFFFVLFLAVLVRMTLLRRKDDFAAAARLPLDGEQTSGSTPQP